MIKNLNLASQPFRNRTLPWLLAAMLLVLSFFSLIFVLSDLRNTNLMTERINQDIKTLQPELDALKKQSDEVKQSLTPEQQKVLVAAHTLVARKQFSWSRLMADLEAVVPRSVGVSRVSVKDIYQKDQQTYAELDFAVLSLDYEAVIAMIGRMNESGIFRAELREQELQKGKGDVTEYKMRLFYQPRNGVPTRQSETNVVEKTSLVKISPEERSNQ